MNDLKKVTIYTDGACCGNPGPGGYGAVLIFGQHQKQISEGFRKTTNNRMEMLAAIKALQMLKESCDVEIISDSKYLVDAVTKGWAKKWKSKNWMRTPKEKAKNADLWKILLELLNNHQAKFTWVKGHAGNQYNEICDELATSATKGKLLVDKEFEREH